MFDKSCWTAVKLMLGVPTSLELDPVRDRTSRAIAAALTAFRDAGTLRNEQSFVRSGRVAENRGARNRDLIRVVKHLETVLNGELHLSMESHVAAGARSGDRRAADGVRTGYSRDASKKIARRADADRIALATVCYLLRAHSLFFCRTDSQRTFNAAKVSLNDLHQAYQFAWRLYHRLDQNHYQQIGGSIEPFFVSAAKAEAVGVPTLSPYFVWSVLLLCDIFRGNIYREIGFLQKADRYYRHAEHRFDLIATRLASPECEAATRVATPTVIRALFERSKVLFDNGHLLESLQRQVRCLDLLVCRSDKHEALQTTIRDRLAGISTYLETERGLQVYDRRGITSRFDLARAKGRRAAASLPSLLRDTIEETHAPLVAAILARIGFTLYTLCPRGVGHKNVAQLLSEFYRFDQAWNKDARTKRQKIRASRLGVYAETLLSPSGFPDPPDESIFSDQIERRFALLLRRMGAANRSTGRTLNEAAFYQQILGSTTQNIGNIVTIPRRNQRMLMRSGYVHRRTTGDLGMQTVYDGLKASVSVAKPRKAHPDSELVNKLVILRRWQSFNPKIPRPAGVSVRGGGYFLLWQGKGIVIDPGYNFIQTFYDEGFSLQDIDAIVITHSHPDHDDDFATLTTLVREWNDFHKRTGEHHLCKNWDLFLNESTHKKFSSWLQASDVKFGRIIPLPSLWWNKDTTRASKGPFRGRTVTLDLRTPIGAADGSGKPYQMAFEVVPAWHDDVIGRTAAVGLKIHLYKPGGSKPVGVIGCTGDTGAYGLRIAKRGQTPEQLRIDCHYRDCDVLIAHLGDIRLRELASAMAAKGSPWLVPSKMSASGLHPLLQLLRTWFKDVKNEPPAVVADRVRQFLDFAITLELLPSWALKLSVPLDEHPDEEIQRWLGAFVIGHGKGPALVREDWRLEKDGLAEIVKHANDGDDPLPPKAEAEIKAELGRGTRATGDVHGQQRVRDAYRFLEFLCIASLTNWQYQFHLGIFGLFRLFDAMAQHDKRNAGGRRTLGRVFVVGELPEELTSYRHAVACWLNRLKSNEGEGASDVRPVYAFTGDIGLHIGLPSAAAGTASAIEPTIRCAFCNQNNETACARANYHRPQFMREFAIKRQQASMIYLCTEKDHCPEGGDMPLDFLSRPERG